MDKSLKIPEQTIQGPNDKVQKDKRTNDDLQKTEDRATRTPLKRWVNSGAPEGKHFLFQ